MSAEFSITYYGSLFPYTGVGSGYDDDFCVQSDVFVFELTALEEFPAKRKETDRVSSY